MRTWFPLLITGHNKKKVINVTLDGAVKANYSKLKPISNTAIIT